MTDGIQSTKTTASTAFSTTTARDMGGKVGTTIAAIATAIVPQQGSVGIVRLSGCQALTIARTLFHAPGQQVWESHRILYGSVRDPKTRGIVDEALLLIMLAPRSYTREDVVEFHCHGGMMVVQQVLGLCLQMGARLAQPGEFTLRAFLNGRIDLTRAESVADLVGAQSMQAAQTALAGLQGKLAQPIRHLRQTCVEILAEIEARIDFEDDLPPLDEKTVQNQLAGVLQQVTDILATADRGQWLRTGLKVAIVGRPNVGKSSLLNAWSRCDRAIVTDLPGTTRDVVESHLVVGGIPVQVLDTAGIRNTADKVERLGIARSRQAAQQADLVLFVIDAKAGWTPGDQAIYQEVYDRPLILIVNKIDQLYSRLDKQLDDQLDNQLDDQLDDQLDRSLPQTPLTLAELGELTATLGFPEVETCVFTSALHHQGIEALEQAILNATQAGRVHLANLDFAINQRQAAALTQAQMCLQQVQAAIAAALPLDFWTIDLRGAIYALGEITGEELTESVLDRIFSQFCIGK